MRATIPFLAATLVALPFPALGQETRGAIEAAADAWEAGWNAGDAAAIAALYAEDAVVMAPAAEPVQGRAAIEAYWRAAISEAAGATVDLETTEVHDLGEVAIEIGRFVDTGPDGGHRDHGRYMVVWKKVDGSWRIARDIYNSSMPQ